LKFSIVIPNYNYENYIGLTLHSILFQKYEEVEVIIVDDGSTDNSVELIKSIQKEFPNRQIKLICQKNSGQANAVNAGLSHVTGDIIGWINSDDFYVDGAFSHVARVFQSPEVSVVFGDINVVDLSGNFIHSLEHFDFSYLISTFTGFANNMSNNAVFWRKESYNNNFRLKGEFKCSLDNELFSRLTYRKKVVHTNKKLANFRVQNFSKASINNSNWDSIVKNEDLIVFENAFQNLILKKYLSVSLAKSLIPFFIFYRRFLKLISGRVIKTIISKIRYNFKKK
jgi:glycosyltransferase involved in cell wall biosynthesis